jgi:hypothetical protein
MVWFLIPERESKKKAIAAFLARGCVESSFAGGMLQGVSLYPATFRLENLSVGDVVLWVDIGFEEREGSESSMGLLYGSVHKKTFLSSGINHLLESKYSGQFDDGSAQKSAFG